MSLKRLTRRIAVSGCPASIGPILLLAFLSIAAQGFPVRDDTKGNDAFLRGNAKESRIAHEVRHQLLMLPYYGVFDDLSFSVDGSTVTLFGKVTRPTLKTDSERVVKSIEGVDRVINKIDVLPVSPMDDQIRLAIYRAIYGDPALATRYGYRSIPPIHIIVENGNVTLTGVVANEADRNIANIRARSVPGVFSVTNNLQMESSS